MLLSAIYAQSQYATIEYGQKPEPIIIITPSPSGRTFTVSENRGFATGRQ
jgi:hypothetical protein